MIGGYILPYRNLAFENICKKRYASNFKEYTLEANSQYGWFFSSGSSSKAGYGIFDGSRLLLVSGFAVVGTQSGKYREFNANIDFKPELPDAFVRCINDIVSNVNSIYVDNCYNHLRLYLASYRVCGGRIWYSQTKDKSGFFFCDDFRLFPEIVAFDIETKAVFSIIRYGVSPDPISVLRSVFSVPPSHYGEYDTLSKNINIRPYFHFDFSEKHGCDLKLTKQLLINSAEFLSKTKPALLLSGGIDSTLYAHYLDENEDIGSYFAASGENDPNIAFARSASVASGLPLNIIQLDSDKVLQVIEQAASHYTHPFSNYGTALIFYLITHIRTYHNGRHCLIDGSGADICFGDLAKNRRRLIEAVCMLPNISGNFFSLIRNNPRFYQANSRAIYVLGLLANAGTDITLITHICCHYNSLFSKDVSRYRKDIDSAFLKLFQSVAVEGANNGSPSARLAIGDLILGTSMVSQKNNVVLEESVFNVVYPYLWKDVLEEQGRLSWDCKLHDGVGKWPLKSLLGEFMDRDFIFRKKVGLVSPMLKWLQNKEVHSLLNDTLLNSNAFISDIVSRKDVRKLIEALPGFSSASESILNFLWGALFCELWLKTYHRGHTQSDYVVSSSIPIQVS
jgi:asparagine synthetase B (glutamine-hydrolysing)